MEPLTIILISAVAVIVAALIFVVVTYNRLITLRNRVENDFSNIDTQLQRRFDLIPNLIKTVKEYARHESSLFEKITELRSSAFDDLADHSVKGAQAAEKKMDSVMASINAVAENYPALRASENFAQLQEELATTENKVSFARQAYNDSVNDYNTKQETFPSNIVAGLFTVFSRADMFRVEDESVRKAPEVDFS